MRNRIFGIVSTLFALVLCSTAVGLEDGSLPDNLLGFLRPGMCVGIQAVDGTTNVLIHVYTGEQYEIARDVVVPGKRPFAAAKLADDHPAVRKTLDTFIEKLLKKSPDADPERVLVFPLPRTSLGSVSAVGDDYVLIEREGQKERRLILAKSSIARIDLDADPLHFAHPSLREAVGRLISPSPFVNSQHGIQRNRR